MMRNPVFESSMKRRMRSFRAPMLLTLYVLFLLLVSGGALVTLQKPEVSLGNLRGGLETYIYLSVMQFMLIVLVAPALTTGAISGERERQTLDLLLCTRVGSMRIVLGKLFSSTCFLALMIISSLPAMAVTLFFGGVSIWEMLYMQLFLLVSALACCSIGIFCSALLKRTVTATVVAYLAIFAIGVGTLAFPLLFQSETLQSLMDAYYASTNGGAQSASEVAFAVPKLFYVNPGLGLFSLLVEQTGLLRNTADQIMGYRGGQLFTIIELLGSLATINMIVMFTVSAVLMLLSALFVKPSGLRAKKKK